MTDRRDQILDAVLPVFAAHGFAGARTRALAAAAGVNVATLAWHFKDKQGLYDAAVDRIYDRLMALDLPAEVAAAPTPRQRVQLLVQALYAQARANADGIRLLLRHVMEHGGAPEPVRARWSAATLASAGQALAGLGPLPEADPRLALLSLNHLVARYAVTDEADLAAFVDGPDPHRAVASHLGEVACRLLGVP
ncbi:TetR/AcrR family transcriptional regulator [Myxococcota bacterium]|nr:TetR/AcrR family transcriptional regulator [Myxococcota bacterium]